jgi:Putative beta-barrel porin-2, OmpL-like. bbp2
MKFDKWTLALASAGVISLGTAVQAEEQHQVLTAVSQTTLSGYVDTSAIYTTGPNGTIPGHTFTGTSDKQDGFNLHAVKLVLEKPLDESEWAAGYKADLVFGPDANYYSTILNGQAPAAGGANSDDFAVKQAYVSLRVPVGNGIDLKMGVWDTLIGYEVFESGNNPNFTRSYGYALEPTHHTGLQASYKISDVLSIAAGVANGWSGAVNDKNNLSADRVAFLGTLTITLPESTGMFAGTAIYLGYVSGENANRVSVAPNGPTINSYYVGATMPTGLEGLSVGLAFDYKDSSSSVGSGMPSYAWASAGYISYQATEKLKLNGRVDYTKASNGTYTGYGPTAGADGEQLGSLTLTADYSLWANVVTRLEARYDRAMGGDEVMPARTPNGSDDAFTLAANVIYKF